MINSIGIDLHGVLDKYPEILKPLLMGLTACGVRIVVVTGPPTLDAVEELEKLGYIHTYTKLGHYHRVKSIIHFLEVENARMWQDDKGRWWTDEETWWSAKAKICEREELQIMIDNEERYQQYFVGDCKFVLMK
jgi:hypothetical protein